MIEAIKALFVGKKPKVQTSKSSYERLLDRLANENAKVPSGEIHRFDSVEEEDAFLDSIPLMGGGPMQAPK